MCSGRRRPLGLCPGHSSRQGEGREAAAHAALAVQRPIPKRDAAGSRPGPAPYRRRMDSKAWNSGPGPGLTPAGAGRDGSSGVGDGGVEAAGQAGAVGGGAEQRGEGAASKLNYKYNQIIWKW